jgi:uncharacterized protein (TIGR02145 family)
MKQGLVLFLLVAAIVFLTCTRDNFFNAPQSPSGYKLTVYVADTTGVAANVSKDSIQSVLKNQISTIPGEPITLFGFITGDTSKVTAKWNFGDRKDTVGTIVGHIYDATGAFNAVFSITDKEGFSIADTVVVIVNRINESAVKGYAKYQGKGANAGIRVVFMPVNSNNTITMHTETTGLFHMDSLFQQGVYDVAYSDSLYGNAFSPCTLHSVTIKNGEENVFPSVTLADNHPPHIFNNGPSGIISIRLPTISANFIDTGSGISPHTFAFSMNGKTIPDSLMKIDTTGFSYLLKQRLPDGMYAILASVQDSAGNPDSLNWSFKVDGMKLTILTPDTTIRRNRDTLKLRTLVSNVYSKVAQYKWDYDGNGTWDDSLASSDTLISRPHAFAHKGTYKAVVYVRDDSGMVKIDTVTVIATNAAPVISSIRPDTTISIKDSIQLFATAIDSEGTIKQYAWDFNGDGTFEYTSATQIQAGYRYDTAGTYKAILRVTDDDNQITYDTARITVLQDGPVPTASTADSVVSIKDTIHLHASATVRSGTIVKWEWDCGNTGKFVTTSKSDTAVIAPSTATAAYACVVRATDSKGNTVVATVTVRVLQDVPVLTASTADTVVSIKDTIHLHSSAIVHSGTIVKWEWDCGNTGNFVTTSKSDTAVIAPSAATPAYVCVVRATDSKGNTITATVTVNVLKDAPVITFISADTIVDHGGTVRCSVYVQQQFGSMIVEIDTANSGSFKSLGGLGLRGGKAYSFSTGNACTWDSVKVRIRDDDSNVVIKGFKVQIRISPPTILKINSDTTIAIKDSVTFNVSATDTFGNITQVAWDFNGDGTYDWTSSVLQNAGYRYPTVGVYKAILRLTDECQKLTYDTIKVTVVRDIPVITFLSGDTIVDHGGTVRCSVYVQQQFGTMSVGIDSANSGNYRTIGSLGLSGGVSCSFSTGNACAWDSAKVRVTDSKGNVVAKGLRVRVRPRPLTITSVDSTPNTITVHYSQSLETDFAQYRIYRNTTNAVDTTDELWATITAFGTVSYTTPTPSYAWQPRYYRIYQADTEGLWSAGSNVAYGNIINSPPAAPVITYPANDGDSVWADSAILEWNSCVDPNGHTVRYRVLLNYNNTGYVQNATALVDTFLQLTGYDSLSFKFKVIAYDTLGDSSACSAERAIFIRPMVTDIDGNTYRYVRIGTQIWMVENLKTTKFNDGSVIPLITDPTIWASCTTSKSPGYCWYNNDSVDYGPTYGAIYNWYAVNTGKLAPTGWHVPTDSEWTVLTTVLGGANVAGGALKSTSTTYWLSPNIGATNSTGFSALPGGSRCGSNCSIPGTFNSIGAYGNWWASPRNGYTGSFCRSMSGGAAAVMSTNILEDYGCSVRCVRN